MPPVKKKPIHFKHHEIYTGPRSGTDIDYSHYYSSAGTNVHFLVAVFIGALVYSVISFIVHMAGAIADMGYYFMPDYFSVWSKLMMPVAGPPPIEFTYASLLFGFIAGLLFTYCFYLVRNSMPGKGIAKGLNYGMFVMLLAGLPFYMTMTLLINLPQGLMLSWLVQTFIIYELSGIAVAKLVR
ncbi:MAG: hypothetical protein Q7T16_02455 [Candidatus Burarchaeum sp.]|nr:hypothetical protein [Candidatus Burarchaeum sp.]MDO8339496.1 hypothetical protein [Candidatus Burarchaeum sp.]